MAFNSSFHRKRVAIKSPVQVEADLQKLFYQRKLEEKGELLEREFMKEIMKKSLDAETEESSEATLKRIFDEFQSANKQKVEKIQKLQDRVEVIELENNPWDEEAVERIRARAELDYRKMSQIARITHNYKPQFYKISQFLNDEDVEMMLKQSKLLEGIYTQLETRILLEEENTDSLSKQLKELTETNAILSQRFYEDLNLFDHTNMRFGRIEVLKDTAILQDKLKEKELNEATNAVESNRKFSTQLLTEIKSKANQDFTDLQDSKTKMSEALVRLDDYRLKNQEMQEKLVALENWQNHMIEKKTESKYIIIYINILESLCGTFLEADEKKKEEKPDEKIELSSKRSSILNIKPNSGAENKKFKRLHLEISSNLYKDPRNSFSSYSPNAKILQKLVGRSKYAPDEEDTVSKKSSDPPTIQKETQIIRCINEFYNDHEEGPKQLVEKLIEKFKSMVFQEKSLRTLYENLSASKNRELNHLDDLMRELSEIQPENMSLLHNLSDEDEEVSQKNQKEINISEGSNKSEYIQPSRYNVIAGDTLGQLNNTFQKLMFRLYLNLSEMMFKFNQIVEATLSQLPNVPIKPIREIEKVSTRLISYINEIHAPKQIKLLSSNLPNELTKMSSTNTIDTSVLHIMEKNYSNPAEQRVDSNVFVFAADMNGSDTIKKLFLGLFENSEKEYKLFEDIIYSDVLIRCFLKEEDIKDYILAQKAVYNSTNKVSEAVVDNVSLLFDQSSKIYLERTEKILSFYTELLTTFLEIEGDTRLLERPIPKMMLTENFKKYQEKRAVQICKQKGYAHPKLTTQPHEKRLRLKENKAAQKEENLKAPLLQEEVESKLNELTAEMIKKKKGVTSLGFYKEKLSKGHLVPSNINSQKSFKTSEDFTQRSSSLRKTKTSDVVATENADYFESERDLIRKNYEERREQYLQEQSLAVNPAIEKISHPEIFRLYKDSGSDYKRKLIKNSQMISQITSIGTQLGRSTKQNLDQGDNYVASMAARLGIRTAQTSRPSKRLILQKSSDGPREKNLEHSIDKDPFTLSQGIMSRKNSQPIQSGPSRKLLQTITQVASPFISSDPNKDSNQLRRASYQTTPPKEFHSFADRHVTMGSLNESNHSLRLFIKQKDTKNTDTTLPITATPSRDSNEVGTAATKRSPNNFVKFKNRKKYKLPKLDLVDPAKIQPYFPHFFFTSSDMSFGKSLLETSRSNTNPSILVEASMSNFGFI